MTTTTLPTSVKQNSTQSIAALVEAQRSYFNSHATKPVAFRKVQLKKLRQLIEKNEDLLHEAIYQDFGKSKSENLVTELYPTYHEIDIALSNVRKWAKPKRVWTNIMNLPATSSLVPEPLGVSLVIGAWNFPYNLSLGPVVASIAAGNTTILKPSEIAPHTSRAMAKLINTSFDKEFLHVVEGGIPETTELINQKFEKVFFTGSPKIGKIVNQAVAKNLTNVTLELGGKNPTIFAKDCSLNVSVKRMIWAKYLNSGQICIAPDYILVERSLKDKFLEQAVKEIEKHQYSVKKGNYVRIINERNFDRLVSLIDADKVYYGGNHSKQDLWIEPTILDNVSLDDPIMEDEIFGPILPVIPYDSIEEVFDIIRRYEKPLAAYLYTNNAKLKKRFLTEIPFGGGAINESLMHIMNSNLPFGGVGNSGQGSYHGKWGFDAFSHHKSVLAKSPLVELDLKYYGYSKSKMSILKKLSLGLFK